MNAAEKRIRLSQSAMMTLMVMLLLAMPLTMPSPAIAEAIDPLFYVLRFNQLEERLQDGNDVFRWDATGWWGGDKNRLWLKSEGETQTSGPSGGDAEVQLLYGRMIASFWDLQIGVREDILFGAGKDRQRTFAVIGLEGLAPYWFEVEPAFFISDEGDVSFRFAGTYDYYLTQRLVVQPRLEINVAFQDAKQFGVESGFNDIEIGLRLRYEFRRRFAPYIGFNWLRQLGDTADLVRSEGGTVDQLGGIVGIQIIF